MKKMGKGDQKMVFIFLSDFTHDVSFVVREFFRFLAKYQSFTETGRRTRARRTIMISSSLLLAEIGFYRKILSTKVYRIEIFTVNLTVEI